LFLKEIIFMADTDYHCHWIVPVNVQIRPLYGFATLYLPARRKFFNPSKRQ